MNLPCYTGRVNLFLTAPGGTLTTPFLKNGQFEPVDGLNLSVLCSFLVASKISSGYCLAVEPGSLFLVRDIEVPDPFYM